MKFIGTFFILIALGVIGCKSPVKETPKMAASIEVTDFRGTTVSLEKPAQRIVCLIESALTGLYMLRANDAVVGIPSAVYNESTAAEYAKLDERIAKKMLPSPGNWDFMNIESVLALQPDLVIIWSSQTEAINLLEQHNIPVYGVFLQSFTDVYKEITDFGKLTGKTERADSLVAYTQQEVAKIASMEVPKKKKRVYFMWSQGLLETAGTTSTVNELMELAGTKNCCPIDKEHVVINKEQLFDWNPDMIVMWHNQAEDPADILAKMELRPLSAIKNQAVHELPSVFDCDLWTLKFPYAAKMLAKWSYPDVYEQMDLNNEREQMMEFLYGKSVE